MQFFRRIQSQKKTNANKVVFYFCVRKDVDSVVTVGKSSYCWIHEGYQAAKLVNGAIAQGLPI